MKKFIVFLMISIVFIISLSYAKTWALTQDQFEQALQEALDYTHALLDQALADFKAAEAETASLEADIRSTLGGMPLCSADRDAISGQHQINMQNFINATMDAVTYHVNACTAALNQFRYEQEQRTSGVSFEGKTKGEIYNTIMGIGPEYAAEAKVSAQVAALTEETEPAWYLAIAKVLSGGKSAEIATAQIYKKLGDEYGLQGLVKMTNTEFKQAVHAIVVADPALAAGETIISRIGGLGGYNNRPDESAVSLIQQGAHAADLRLENLPVKGAEPVFAPVLGPEPKVVPEPSGEIHMGPGPWGTKQEQPVKTREHIDNW